ncbi:MAG: metallophosphoesterase [Tannerellaceae bacterium]|nr:metallophosphoesterase [Tannerellaceae bacterium]
MWFLLAGLVITALAVMADILLYRSLANYSPTLRRTVRVINLLTTLYSLVFLFVYAFQLIYFHDMLWGVFLYMIFNFPKLIFLFWWLLAVGPVPKERFTTLRKAGISVGIGMAVFVFLVMLYGALIGRTHMVVKEVVVRSDRLPQNFSGFRVLHFSDFHLGSFYHDRFIKRAVEKINELDADIILFTGDIVNDRSLEMEPFIATLARLRARHGVYSVLGNYDYGDYYDWQNIRQKEDNFNQMLMNHHLMGWDLLIDEHRMIRMGNDSIVLLGVGNWGDPPFQQYGNLEKAYEGVNREMFAILMSHNPVHWRKEVLSDTPIDLTLSGHAHAMQMQAGNVSPAALRYKDWAGLFREGNQYMYVNQGIGNIFFPMRIGNAYPEITILELRANQ